MILTIESDNVECMTIDIDDFFILSCLPHAEYIRIRVPILPDDILEEFRLNHNGYKFKNVCMDYHKRYLAQKELVDFLAT